MWFNIQTCSFFSPAGLITLDATVTGQIGWLDVLNSATSILP